MADPFGQAAAHAPQPMQAAASIARSASCLGIGVEFASGAEPARAERRTGSCGNESPGLHDPVQCASIDYQVFDDRK